MAKSIVQEEKDKQKTAPLPEYDENETVYLGRLIDEMTRARNQREQQWIEFDDMSYTAYNLTNARANKAYIRPKRNAGETRVVTGITAEKSNALLSMLLNFNFEANITAIDKKAGRVIDELGEQMEDLIRKSEDDEVPEYGYKRALIYGEALEQGDAFIELSIQEGWVNEKVLEKPVDWSEGGMLKAKWSEEPVRAWRRLSTKLIPGLSFYAGNIKSFWMDEQPFIFVRKVIPYSLAKQVFGKWERWESVPRDISAFTGNKGDLSEDYNIWTLEDIEHDQVEVLMYQNKPSNEMMILCNGVMMMKVGFPLSSLTGKAQYTVRKLSIQPINEYFFYSKSVPAKTKSDQAILDEFYRLMIMKTRQSVMPPMANNTGVKLDRRIFLPAMLTDDINPEELKAIVDTGGVTQAEFNMVKFINGQIDNKSVSPTFQGQALPGQQTAREILELQKQSIQKLGLIILGTLQFEKELAELRLDNILYNLTIEEETEVDSLTGELKISAKIIELDSTFADGTGGRKIIEISENQPTSEQILAEEELLSRHGMRIRKVYLSPTELRSVELMWKVDIQPTEKDSDALEQVQFRENVLFTMNILGPQVFSQDWLLNEIAKSAGWDSEQAFQQQALPQGALPGQEGTPPGVLPQGGPQGSPQRGATETGERAAQGLRQSALPREQAPTLNTLLQA